MNLFTLAIASFGERKSSVFRVLTAPIYAAQDDYAAKHAEKIARSKREYSLLKKQIEEAERSFAKDGDEAVGERIHKLDAELRNFKLLTAPKLLLDDVTSEKLIDVLDEQQGSVTIASAEGGLFISLKTRRR
jgi:transcription elongation GreA/GreB family factor